MNVSFEKFLNCVFKFFFDWVKFKRKIKIVFCWKIKCKPEKPL